ncbi:MAG: hypothetical protein AAGA62_13615 [Bacteroidota bacterium]
MHDIEPHFGWRERYRAEHDELSPFFGREYDEFGFSNRVYNYLLHPQWDEFGAETLYLKLLFADYDEGYAIIEMIGEWNDAVHNDVMHLKREFIDQLVSNGIRYFILILEGVLNFHGDEVDYYEEWQQDIQEDGGWIALLNLHDHVQDEFTQTRLEKYLHFGGHLNGLNWRPQKPSRVFEAIDGLIQTEVKRVY